MGTLNQNAIGEAVEPWFSKLMFATAETCGTKLTEMRVRSYARLLSDLDADVIKAAFARAVKEGSFFPQVADIRRHAEPSVEDAALLAWAALRRAAEVVGAYSSIEIEDGCAAVALAIAFGSWPAYCETENGPELHARRAEFMAAYRAARRLCATVQRLPGVLELQGGYAGDERSCVGRLTAAGNVVIGPRPALTAGAAAKQLPDGGLGAGEA